MIVGKSICGNGATGSMKNALKPAIIKPMVKAAGFEGPLQLHMEYPELGGPNDGKTTFSIPKADLLAMMRRDVATLKSYL